MSNKIKTIHNFKSDYDIDNIIAKWAKSSAFKESTLPHQVRNDDITYCFSYDDEDTITLITINILDGKVLLEAWMVENVKKNQISQCEIHHLLKMLGQETE